MKKTVLLMLVLSLSMLVRAQGDEAVKENYPKLDNPFTVDYLKKHIKQTSPRLIMDNDFKNRIQKQIKTSPYIESYYKTLQLEANEILTKPFLERILEGKRLLSVSREMMNRMGVLSMVYLIDEDPLILKRIDDEIKVVCAFTDWNPDHFLDVAEMAYALATAIDWVGDKLPRETVALAKKSLYEKAMKASYADYKIKWISGNDNWSQVCHAGMIAAAIITADENPTLSAKVIGRALDNLPNVMKEYGPDGIYPEGVTYWHYGTAFNVLIADMLQTAFGQDYGIKKYPAFLKSADFIQFSTGPTNTYFNFSDCGLKKSSKVPILLNWFVSRTNNLNYFDKDFFSQPPEKRVGVSRLSGTGLIWISQIDFSKLQRTELPITWSGGGLNPLAFFRNDWNDPNGFYLGMKGGSASVNHGNMDVGSFIFELDSVRWVVDPGNQKYYSLEKEGFDLWETCQECERWSLLTKNNMGHSTLTVDGKRHNVEGYASIVNIENGKYPQVTFDLDEIFIGQLDSAIRTFKKVSNSAFILTDEFKVLQTTEEVTWAIMTTADVTITDKNAILTKDGKQLKLKILSDLNLNFSVISLETPPMKLDKVIVGLKRLEIRMPAYIFPDRKGKILVQFSGEE